MLSLLPQSPKPQAPTPQPRSSQPRARLPRAPRRSPGRWSSQLRCRAPSQSAQRSCRGLLQNPRTAPEGTARGQIRRKRSETRFPACEASGTSDSCTQRCLPSAKPPPGCRRFLSSLQSSQSAVSPGRTARRSSQWTGTARGCGRCPRTPHGRNFPPWIRRESPKRRRFDRCKSRCPADTPESSPKESCRFWCTKPAGLPSQSCVRPDSPAAAQPRLRMNLSSGPRRVQTR